MNKLQESLIILRHFNNLIESRTNFCKRYSNFNVNDCVKEKMLEYLKNGSSLQDFKDEKIIGNISRECADTRIILHSYICLNIIDMFSFNDEYNKYFTVNICDDDSLKKKMINVKTKNKEIKNKINWDELKKYRNNVLAHNLRNNNNKISLDVLKSMNFLITNFEYAISYSEVVLNIYKNIECEFTDEILVADNLLKISINDLKKSN